MNIALIGFILETAGKIMVGYTAIAVHYRFRKEHQVDENVFSTMKKEQLLGVIGIVLMVVGAGMQIPSFL